jgi:plastocyanin
MKLTLGIAALAAVCVALASAASKTVSEDTTGTVKGRIVFEGKLPEMKPLEITSEQEKGCCPEGRSVDTVDRSLLVDSKGGIANVVVTIEVDGAKPKPLAEGVEIDQHECHFEPHVIVAPVGTKVVFLNSDKIAHNVHTYAGKNDSFNQTIAPGAKHEQELKKEDRIEIKCDIHPWMNSHLIVADTPYYAVTKPDGSFEIPGLPAGEYKIELWHERLGKGKGTAVVKDDGSSEPVELKLGEEKKSRRR